MTEKKVRKANLHFPTIRVERWKYHDNRLEIIIRGSHKKLDGGIGATHEIRFAVYDYQIADMLRECRRMMSAMITEAAQRILTFENRSSEFEQVANQEKLEATRVLHAVQGEKE